MASAKRYRTLFIEPGLVEYSDENQRETVLVQRKALEKMRPSFLGKPVFNFIHRDTDPEEAFDMANNEEEDQACGIISEVGYDAESGYDFADLMIWDLETQENIDKNGFNVSCAYIPTDTGPGGIHNSIKFDSEVLDGEYQHLAIVEDPRYGGAKIFENSKSGGNMKRKFVFGKKRENADPPEEKKEEETVDNAEDAYIEVDGEKVPVEEMVNAYKASMSNAEEDKEKENGKENMLNMEDTVEIDGKEVTMQELYDNYSKDDEKENAEPATDDPLEPAVKENAANPKPDPKKKNENFRKIQNAADRGAAVEKPNVRTQTKRLSEGQARYGSPVKNGGAE